MKQKLRPLILTVLLLVFVVSFARIIYQAFQYREGDKTYSEAAELVDLPDFSDLTPPALPDLSAAASPQPGQEEPVVYVDPYADALRNMDFSALQEVNSDVLGWILIPNTNISYPVVQGSDNDYYLNHTWKKTFNTVGAIFLECQNSRNLHDFNTIIYGHRMNNHSMFGTLSQYKSHSYWAQHPYIYITDANGSHKYEVFAAYEVSVEGSTYQLGFPSDQSKQAFLDFCTGQSVLDTGVVPTVYDRVLTLSTCTGNGHATRWVVQAVLRGEAPPDTPAETPAVETPASETPVMDSPAVETPAETASGETPSAPPAESSAQPEESQPAPTGSAVPAPEADALPTSAPAPSATPVSGSHQSEHVSDGV